MNYLILSDIHGSASALQRVLDFYDKGHYDMLLLLGDLLNYGPRNGLPEGLDAQAVAKMLNERAKDIVAVRGNCDSEVDQMLLDFPIMQTFSLVCDSGHRMLLTHGHVYGENNLPPAPGFDILLQGHTHLWKLVPAAEGKPIICNTGSPTFPKGGNVPTFATLEGGVIAVRSLNGEPLKQIVAF